MSFENQSDFAFDLFFLKLCQDLLHGSAKKLLMHLGKLAGDHDSPSGTESYKQILQRLNHAMRGLIEDQRLGNGFQLLKKRPPLARFGGKESEETE